MNGVPKNCGFMNWRMEYGGISSSTPQGKELIETAFYMIVHGR